MRTLLLAVLYCTAAFAQKDTGSKACAACHADIYRSYSQTAMARTSGRIDPAAFKSFTFPDPLTRATYRITPQAGALLLGITKDGARIERHLAWFLGSGRVGKSFLFSVDQFLFQSPVSYYSETGHWALSPGFERRSAIDLTRAVEPACLQCHATSINSIPATKNGYAPEAILEPGIGCERCHGPGSAHIASKSARDIVHPGKLAAQENESVCAQCHLTGATRIAKFRADKSTYRPGQNLGAYLSILIASPEQAPALAVTSHFEKMIQSRCRIASGPALKCTSCHDPHREPDSASRATFFRQRCQSCHASKPCTAGSTLIAAQQNDCTACHMPKATARGVQHAVYTDHSIPRLPGKSKAPAFTGLKDFWGAPIDARDLALAQATLGDTVAALPNLEAAAQANPADLTVLSQLAQILDRQSQSSRAALLYESILKLDATNGPAAANLGVLRIQQGDTPAALKLWRQALAQNPAQTGIRMNIAMALYRSGDLAGAKSAVLEALKYDPDLPAARKLLASLP